MGTATQAFVLTGELFCLSFVAIFVFWFAGRLRSTSWESPSKLSTVPLLRAEPFTSHPRCFSPDDGRQTQ
jgi:hypothetical protein